MGRVMKTRNFTLLACTIFLVVATFAKSPSQVFAQSPCVAQLSSAAIPPNSSPNILIIVPVSATCSNNGQVYAVGDARDTSTNTDFGLANTGLSPQGNSYSTGQLNFFLPTSTQGDTIQISVSIYANPFGIGSILATTSQTLTLEQ